MESNTKEYSKEKPEGFYLEIKGKSIAKAKEVKLMNGSKSQGIFKRNSHFNSPNVFSSSCGQNLRLEEIESQPDQAIIYLRGFNNGSHRGRISVEFKAQKKSSPKIIS